MRSKYRFYLIGLLMAALVLVVACNAEPEVVVETVIETVIETQQVEVTRVVEGEVVTEVQEVEVEVTRVVEVAAEEESTAPTGPTQINISYLQQFVDLNPHNLNNQAAVAVADGLFDTLVRVTPDGEVIPWLAESWDISDDGLSIVFHLREGVNFIDGTPVNADAVIASADLFQDPDLYLGRSVLSMSGWEKVDDYTVEFTFDYPDATALYTLSSGTTAIISPTAWETMGPEEFAINPVGSGPYMLEKWEPGVEIIMVKNPDYWQEGVGLADTIVWRNFQDGGAAVLAAQAGELDLLMQQEPKDVPLFLGIDGFQVDSVKAGWYSLVLNTRIPPFDKIENRMAFAYAIDYNALVNVGFEGWASPAEGLIPPDSWAYVPGSVAPLTMDLDAAREMLAAACNPDGFTFKVSVTPQPFRSQLLQIMQSSLSEVGITLEIEVNEFARHIEILRDDHNGANAGFVVQQNLHPDPAQWMRLYAGCNALVGMSGWCDPESGLDELLAASVATFDRDERIAILDEANKMEMEQFVVIPYAFNQTIYAWNSDKLGEFTPSFTGGYNYLYLQPAE
ncbi:MAG: ABC transporter substrate-binding protein [Anaerolineales bacterium]|nr:ABC transporter substrate-binding protein [Anaerolineales bacterium]